MSCVADVVCQCPGLSALQRADGENRSENRGGSLAAIIADFCNKISHQLTIDDPQMRPPTEAASTPGFLALMPVLLSAPRIALLLAEWAKPPTLAASKIAK